MKIVVDTMQDITQLFSMISNEIKEINEKSELLLDNFILISAADSKTKKLISKIISKYIIETFEKKIAYKYIKPFELLKEDALKIINCLCEDKTLKEKRQKIIEKEIYTILSSGHLNIDGTVVFRLEEYKKELSFTLDLLIDEFSAKKSYDEFISLMKYFTDIQPPVTDTVVLEEVLGEYNLTDISGNPIELKFDEEFADELMPISITGEDLLISNLMAAMPKKIIFNNVDENKPIINTIRQIFEGRISNRKEK